MPSPAANQQAQFSNDRAGWAQRWAVEFKAAREALKDWLENVKKINKRYLAESTEEDQEKLNLFSANINTQTALLYGKPPQIDVDRRFNDVDDDVARVGAEILQRDLNSDIERSDDGYALTLEYCVGDFLREGMAMSWLRYVRETEPTKETPAKLGPDGAELAPAVPAGERVTHEDVETVYVFHEDHLWSPCRVFTQVRWWAFKAELTYESIEETFGKDVADAIQRAKEKDKTDAPLDPWQRTDVWEVWDKEHKCKWWYVEGYPETLTPIDVEGAAENGSLPDPLGLKGFWPFARPMMANLTTTKFLPTPNFNLTKCQYDGVDRISDAIYRLVDEIRVTGTFDAGSPETEQVVGGTGNKLYPSKNFAAFAEKGGLKGSVDILDLTPIVNAIDKLRELRVEEMNLAYQSDGMSDIMRGQATAAGTTATEQAIKAKAQGVRTQRTQDEVARYASDIQRVRGEIMAQHFSPETLLARANLASMPSADRAYVQDAVALLQSEFACYRITVKPEAISLTDYAALKQERTEIIAAIAGYLQVAGPLAQQSPAVAPFLLQILQWMVAGLKGGSSLESVLDQAVKAAQQAAANPQPPQPDPQLEVAKVKAQAEKVKAGADMQKTKLDMQKSVVEHQMDMQKLQAETTLQTEHRVQAEARAMTPGRPQ